MIGSRRSVLDQGTSAMVMMRLLCRHLKAPLPDAHLHLSVGVSHPEHGDYFSAVLTGLMSSAPSLRNEHAGWRVLLRCSA